MRFSSGTNAGALPETDSVRGVQGENLDDKSQLAYQLRDK
jgi:hypothetical protein